MQIQFSTTENCSSLLLANGLSFEGVPPADPPDNTGGGTGANEPDEEEEEPDTGRQLTDISAGDLRTTLRKSSDSPCSSRKPCRI